MKLIPVDPSNERHLAGLYDLLAERSPAQSISHKKMPTWDQHLAFVSVMDPADGDMYSSYLGWRLVEVDGVIVGSIYLTQRHEIGISIFKAHQRKGFGPEAVVLMMKEYAHIGGPFYANINPANEASRKMFEKLGFKTIQHTLALEAE